MGAAPQRCHLQGPSFLGSSLDASLPLSSLDASPCLGASYFLAFHHRGKVNARHLGLTVTLQEPHLGLTVTLQEQLLALPGRQLCQVASKDAGMEASQCIQQLVETWVAAEMGLSRGSFEKVEPC